jgi:T-complex protein 1 subunit epsilon
MREHFVIDPLIGKRSQLLLATQLCRMVSDFFLEIENSTLLTGLQVLKINNVIMSGDDDNEF